MKKLSKTFNVEPADTDVLHPITKPKDEDIKAEGNTEISNYEKELDDDYQKARENLHSLLDVGNDILKTSLENAVSLETPKGFEVAGDILKKMADMNEQMVKLHSTRIDNLSKMGKGKSKPNANMKVTNNNLFLTTNELLNSIENKNKGDENDK